MNWLNRKHKYTLTKSQELTIMMALFSRVRRVARDALWRLSDRLCAHRLTFELGHWIGELGWKLRD